MIASSLNYKGGQGKSFWAAILADFLGPKVELLDLDQTQGDSHVWAQKAGRPSRLVPPRDVQRTLHEAAQAPSWAVVDCPPHEGEPTRLALEFSALVLIPVIPGGAPDAQAWGRIAQAINEARLVNSGLKAAVVLNCDRRTQLSASFVEMLKAWHSPHKGQALIGAIPLKVAMAEAIAAGKAPKDESISKVLVHLRRFAATK